METIKIGLIGAGGNTRTRHIPGFLNIENIELTAVANRSLESSKKIADEFGEHLFSMTFIPSNLVVLTQRYPTEELYYNSLPLRNEIMSTLKDKDIIDYYKASEPVRVDYD